MADPGCGSERDADVGKKAEQSTKGYFGRHSRHRRGRKLARVLASQYDEIVVDELYPGNTNLVMVLPSLIEKAEEMLVSTPLRRQHTIIRIDAGGGSIGSLNHLLEKGYAIVCKEYSAERTSRLVKSVKQWVQDSERPDRQVGWVTEESLDYLRPVRRLGLRWKIAKGSWRYGVLLVAGLSPKDVLHLLGEPEQLDEVSIMSAYAHFYDQRGGGIETSFGEDKGGLGITKRNKKREDRATLAHVAGNPGS